MRPGGAGRKWEKEPLLHLLWEEYCLCRELVIIPFVRKSQRGEKTVMMMWTTGFNQLPNQGGVRDQSYFVMRIFNAFLAGERRGQQRAAAR